MGDDSVQIPGRDDQIPALLGLHQGGNARRKDRHTQPGGIQMPGVVGLGRTLQFSDTGLHPAQPLRLSRAKAVHTKQGGGAQLPHQCPGQLL